MSKVLWCLAVSAAAVSAESVTQHDRDFTMSYLHATRKQILDAVDGLSEAQWKFKPADDKWSVAEVLEHLVLAERGIYGMARKLAESATASPAPATKVEDAVILKNLPSRERKVQSPEMFVPTGRFGVGQPEIDQFKQTRDTTITYIRDTDLDLRSRFGNSPFGPLDCVQWLLYIAAHSERHLGQILEVKGDPKFPR